jgi:N-acetyl-D-muramate 6-phosphate phosphatase
VVEAVLFDLDGTLADTAPDMARTVNLMRASRGLAPVALEVVRPHVSNGARGMIGSAFGYKPEHPEFPAMREEFLTLYADNLCIDSRLFPGMAELLDALERQGLAWGVVTNKFERLARAVLEGLGVAHRARTIVGGDTCARPKPFPDSLLHAASAIKVPANRILYVGDDERDVQAARAAGMGALVAGYGYVGTGAPPSAWGADGIVDSASAIAAWIGLGRASARPAL